MALINELLEETAAHHPGVGTIDQLDSGLWNAAKQIISLRDQVMFGSSGSGSSACDTDEVSAGMNALLTYLAALGDLVDVLKARECEEAASHVGDTLKREVMAEVLRGPRAIGKMLSLAPKHVTHLDRQGHLPTYREPHSNLPVVSMAALAEWVAQPFALDLLQAVTGKRYAVSDDLIPPNVPAMAS